MIRLTVEIRDNGDVVFRTDEGKEILFGPRTILDSP